MTADLKKIKQALDDIRPMIQLHNGDVELVEIKDDIVYVKFHGACVGCPISTYTLKLGIEQKIKEVLPRIKEVQAVE